MLQPSWRTDKVNCSHPGRKVHWCRPGMFAEREAIYDMTGTLQCVSAAAMGRLMAESESLDGGGRLVG